VLDAGAGEGATGTALRNIATLRGPGRWRCEMELRRAGRSCGSRLLTFRESSFHACLNIVTLSMSGGPPGAEGDFPVLVPGGRLLLVFSGLEVHQAPHDYYRYTLHGVSYLLEQAGLTGVSITPAGGYFRLMSRRLLNGLEYFSGGFRWLGFVPAMALLGFLPFFSRIWISSTTRRFHFGVLMHRRQAFLTMPLMVSMAVSAADSAARVRSSSRGERSPRPASSRLGGHRQSS